MREREEKYIRLYKTQDSIIDLNESIDSIKIRKRR